MGCFPEQLKTIQLKDYALMWRAYHKRQEIEKWDVASHVIASIINHSGMRFPKKPILPNEIFNLSLYRSEQFDFITNDRQAIALLNTF